MIFSFTNIFVFVFGQEFDIRVTLPWPLLNLSLGHVRHDPGGAAVPCRKKFNETFLHCQSEQMEEVWIRKPACK